MKEMSLLIFIERNLEYRLDDPVFEIRALDPRFRIRENVHTGYLEKTGYAIEVFIDNNQQLKKLIEYLKLKNIKDCLVITDDYAYVLDIERNKTRDYSNVYYYDSIFQIDRHIGYSIHLEDSRFIGNIPYMILGSVKNRHPELSNIDNGRFVSKFVY